MTSRHLVDPDLLATLDSFPDVPLTADLLPLLRTDRDDRLAPAPAEAIAQTNAERMTIRGPAGAPDVEVLLIRPVDAAAPLGCILHVHGGGYVAGSTAAVEPVLRSLAHTLGCAIVSVEYRLAPETRFPGAVEDCYAALAWLHGTAPSLGIERARIGVMGESAGGGLAAALALLTRDRGEHRLAFQHLIYPMIDDRTCTSAEPNPHAGEFVWNAQRNMFGWRALLGHEPGGPAVSPYAAAARATDLAGLPPAYLSIGSLDLFVDENLDYATRLVRAGVPTELHVYPGGYHGFDFFADAPVCRRARAESVAALGRALA